MFFSIEKGGERFLFEICRNGISPGGLASQSYSGVMFFDMDW